MFLEYLVGAIGLIPIYIFIIRKLNLKLSTALYIYSYRAIFSLVYIFYASNNPADANMYLMGGKDRGIIGTGFINRIIELSSFLSIKGYALYSLFGLLGAVGCCYLYCAIKSCNIRSPKKMDTISIIFCFLPSLAFWTLAPGKDSIIFLVINYALYSYIKLEENSIKINLKIIISILILLLIRPHVGASLVISYIIFFTTQIKKKRDAYLRLIFLLIVSITFWQLIPFLQKYASIENYNLIDSFYLLEERFSVTSFEGSNSNYISRVIFFLLTPLPKISFSPLYLADYINTIYVVYYLYTILKDQKSYKNIQSNHFFIFSIILLLLLPLVIFNPGVATRQKWMLLPPLIVSLQKNRYLNYKKFKIH